MFSTESQMPLRFGYEHRVVETPFVIFNKKIGESVFDFYQDNPYLEQLAIRKGFAETAEP
jgi:hypothetical protein